MCSNDSDLLHSSEYFPFIDVMNDTDFHKSNSNQDVELLEKIQIHKRSNSSGFNSLQKRIEKVKKDLNKLSNKLISSDSEGTDTQNGCLKIDNTIENIDIQLKNGTDNMTLEKNKNGLGDDDARAQVHNGLYKSRNSFSELSENTQKIIGKLNFQENANHNNPMNFEDFEIEMEEDEIEFTFSQTSNNLLDEIMSKEQLPIIQEEDEEDLSSDESESEELIAHGNVVDNESIPRNSLLHSLNVTPSDSYRSANVSNQIQEDKYEYNVDGSDEYFNDLTKWPTSIGSSEKSTEFKEADKIMALNVGIDDNFGQSFENIFNTEDDQLLTLDIDHDNYARSTEDLIQSLNGSDSLHENAYKSMIKSSLPDLSGSACSPQFESHQRPVLTKSFSKSTDLDEILDQVPLHYDPSQDRLSQSMCNLVLTQQRAFVKQTDSYRLQTSFDNLQETDLDSGYVSIYRSVTETEIPPKVKFSSSMINVSQIKPPSPLVSRLQKMASSVIEMRIAHSLTKLNIPSWLHLTNDENLHKRSHIDDQQRHSLPDTQDVNKHVERTKRDPLRPRPSADKVTVPVIKTMTPVPFVLPSQVLRQNSQRKLTPIKMCQARQFLLPNKLLLTSITNPPVSC